MKVKIETYVGSTYRGKKDLGFYFPMLSMFVYDDVFSLSLHVFFWHFILRFVKCY